MVASIFPESAEAIRSKLGVEHGVLDVFVPRVVLDGVSVLTVVGELELDRRESGGQVQERYFRAFCLTRGGRVALTLFTIPVTYRYMERISERLGRIGRRPRRQSGRTLDPADDRPVVISETASE
ncbi:MAG: hypothetical protein QOH05_1602 [Acetobacteraceae bacterium]|nr:hypothetical protein [Acetobacteraceae bacterium]